MLNGMLQHFHSDQGNLSGESVAAAILVSCMEQSYCIVFRSLARQANVSCLSREDLITRA